MKPKTILSTIAAFFAVAGTTIAQPVLSVDFQPTTGINAEGFSVWDGGSASGNSTTPQQRIFGEYTVHLAPAQGLTPEATNSMGWRVRDAQTAVGFAQNTLFRDFVFGVRVNNQPVNVSGLNLTINGLTPSAEYHFKVYSYDSSSGFGNRVSNWSANSVPVVYRYTFFGAGVNQPILDDQFTFRFNATADASGQIVIEGLSAETSFPQNPAAFLNGFEMYLGAQTPQLPREIFWTETGGSVESQGSVWSSGFNGVGTVAIATGLTRPFGIDVDAANGHVYWAENGWGTQPSRIVRANLDGSELTVLFNGPEDGFSKAHRLVLDLVHGHVYWGSLDGMRRGNLDGTGYTVLGGSATTALDLDSVNGHIYYGDSQRNGALYRMDLSGANDTFIASPLATTNGQFNAISVDVANGYIYYADRDAHQIKRMDLNGSNQVSLLTDADTFPQDVAVGTGGKMYWVGGGGRRLGTANVDGVSDVNLRLISLASEFAVGIVVVDAPVAELRITDITRDELTITINWKGGQPPYQLLRRTNVAEGTWQPVGVPTDTTQATDTLTGDAMFYRVQGN